jgi:hypothetical protein
MDANLIPDKILGASKADPAKCFSSTQRRLRFMIVDSDYQEFLIDLYKTYPGLVHRPFNEQVQVRMGTLFGTADFISSALREMGHEAIDICVNNEFAQKAWLKELGLNVKETQWKFVLRRGVIPWCKKTKSWVLETLASQIKYYMPDVLLNRDMGLIPPHFLRRVRPSIGYLIGQHAATQLPKNWDYRCYDFLISSFPPTVAFFNKTGVTARLQRLCFEPNILERVPARERIYPVTCVSRFLPIHSSRTDLVESLCKRIEGMRVWTSDTKKLATNSIIHKCTQGPAWGRKMYEILAASKITINHHGNVPPFANNYRLFEATGMGALLITDYKDNLQDMFEVGKEIVAYRSIDECVEMILYYLGHEAERAAIAYAGQQRTLREHTFRQRIAELCQMICRVS